MYEVGKVYIWQHQVGRFAYLNGTECTVTGPRKEYRSELSGTTEVGWPTDTPAPHGEQFVTMAEAGDLRPKDPPPGERSIMELFKLPELADA